MRERESSNQPIPKEIKHLDEQGNKHLEATVIVDLMQGNTYARQDARDTLQVLLWSKYLPRQYSDVSRALRGYEKLAKDWRKK